MCNLWAVRCFCPAVLRLAGLADHRAGNLCASPGALTTRMAFHDVNVYILNILIGLINSETSGLAWHRLEISVRKVFDSVMFTFKQRLSPLHSLCVVHYVHAAFAPIMLLISQVAPLHWELLDLWGLDMTSRDFTWAHMTWLILADPFMSSASALPFAQMERLTIAKHRVGDAFRSTVNAFTTTGGESKFLENGTLTPEEFVAAGDQCLGWSQAKYTEM